MSKVKAVICPYCGETQPASERCKSCGGLFESLSLQATHNAMGPWFVRDPARPFQPGCSYETLVRLIERGQVTKLTLLRGPTTKQFWTIAKRVGGVAHLLGYCYSCDASVDPGDHGCHSCGVPFGAYLDRNYLGLPEVRPMPWDADVEDAQRMNADEGGDARAEALDWGRISPGGGRALSSFASDEELLSATASGGPRRAAALGTSRESQAVMEPALAAATVPSPAPGLTADVIPGPTARALQRRLAQQQRTIHWLLGGLGLIIVLTLLLAIRALSAAGNSGVAPRSSPQGPSPLAASREPSSSPPPPSAAPPPVTPDAPDPPPASREPATAPPPPSPVTTPTEASSPHYAELQRALALLSNSEQADRPLTDRIRDADEAVQILKNIHDSVPPAEHPPDLPATLAKAEKQLERLRLGEFYP